MKSDLHIRTSATDGSVSVDDIVEIAMQNGVERICVTDLDSIASSTRARVVAKNSGQLDAIVGAEFSATDHKRNKAAVRILCYDPKVPERLEELCEKNTRSRVSNGKSLARRIVNKYRVPASIIKGCAKGSSFISPYHIMESLTLCGKAASIFDEAFKDDFDEFGKDRFIFNPNLSPVREVIKKIHEAEGVAVLAAPGRFDSFELLEELASEGVIDGVEVWSPYNTPERQEQLIETAKKYNLIMTGGSSFLGKYAKKAITIGDYCTPDDRFDALISLKRRKI